MGTVLSMRAFVEQYSINLKKTLGIPITFVYGIRTTEDAFVPLRRIPQSRGAELDSIFVQLKNVSGKAILEPLT
jgi:hypothetical protein